jgi:two-component system, NarL family, response regulator LiaR
MRKTILLYSLIMAVLIFLLKFIEYRFIVRDLSLEFYIGAIAVMFTLVGIWAGLKLTSKKTVIVQSVPSVDFILNEEELKKLGISKREHEVLELMASGFTNQEIADKLFVSVNTVKTHSANLFVKLDVKRRTQAVQKGKSLRLIP